MAVKVGEEKLIKVGELAVGYECWGAGEAVVILHGWGSGLEEWRGVAKELARTNQVWLIRLPGFGNSTAPLGDWDDKSYVRLVGEFLQLMKINNPVVIGHSFGGRLAGLIATQYKVKKLILIDSAQVAFAGWKTWGFKMVLGLLVKMWGGIGVPKRYVQFISRESVEAAYRGMPVFKRAISADRRRELALIKVPTLVVWGLWDVALPVWEGVLIAKLISGAKLVVMPYSAHMPHIEETDRFLEVLAAFGVGKVKGKPAGVLKD